MVIVPNKAEVESILLRLNHQLPAFLLNYLLATTNMPPLFVGTLPKKSCNPHLFNEAFQCKWDVEKWVVTRPNNEAIQCREAENAKDKWYTNILVSPHLEVNQVLAWSHTAAQAMYDLDAEKLVTTIHQRQKDKLQHAALWSERDGDSLDDDEDMDSASTNACKKSFFTVGFWVEQEEVDSDSASSVSDFEPDVVPIVGNGNLNCQERGKGG